VVGMLGHGWLAVALLALFVGAQNPAVISMESSLTSSIVEERRLGIAFGVLNGVNGVGDLVSSIVAGVLWTLISPAAAFGFGAVLCALPHVTAFKSFYPTLILYCALYAPTLALGNSLSLHHLRDSKTDFPRVKILSAVGWIAGGVTLSLMKGEQSPAQFYLAGAVSILLGAFSLVLPHTPPKKVGQNISLGQVLGLDALALMKKPSFAIFIGCLFLICIPLYFYFVMMSIYLTELQWTGLAGKMTLAQISDVIFLFLLPLMLKNLGYKKTIFMGILAWATRYFLLSGSVNALTLQTPLIFAAILLHGVCYDFLFIAGQLYVDDEANERIRGACQGFIAFILWGIGAFVGTMLAGKVLALHTLTNVTGPIQHNWREIWMTPALGASAVLILFLIFFHDPPRKSAASGKAGDVTE